MRIKIRKFKMESDAGAVNVHVCQGCVGMWVSASREIKTPLAHHVIRPVQWVADLNRLSDLL